jgi:hypothetical protein
MVVNVRQSQRSTYEIIPVIMAASWMGAIESPNASPSSEPGHAVRVAAMTQQSRALISIDSAGDILLAQDVDISDLKRRIEIAAVETRFVDFSTADGTHLNVLISPHRMVSIAILPPQESWDSTPLVGMEDLPPDLMDF